MGWGLPWWGGMGFRPGGGRGLGVLSSPDSCFISRESARSAAPRGRARGVISRLSLYSEGPAGRSAVGAGVHRRPPGFC